jgi:hypothetical protein
MNSVYNRANAIFGYAVTVLFVATVFNAFTGYFLIKHFACSFVFLHL